jgi:hypothetical protein
MVEKDDGRRMLVRSIRYFDEYRPAEGEWRIHLRHHNLQWMYEVPLTFAQAGPERAQFAQFLAQFGIDRR